MHDPFYQPHGHLTIASTNVYKNNMKTKMPEEKETNIEIVHKVSFALHFANEKFQIRPMKFVKFCK